MNKHCRRGTTYCLFYLNCFFLPKSLSWFICQGIQLYLYGFVIFGRSLILLLFFYGLKHVISLLFFSSFCLLSIPFNRFEQIRLFFINKVSVLYNIFDAIFENPLLLQLINRTSYQLFSIYLFFDSCDIVFCGILQKVQEIFRVGLLLEFFLLFAGCVLRIQLNCWSFILLVVIA